MINIEKKLQEIEAAYYWDIPVYDVQISYFGDEVSISYQDTDNEEKYWRVTFLLVGKVDYNNYGYWSPYRGSRPVKEMSSPQYHYFAQEFDIKPYKDDFVECHVELVQMKLTIICRDIKIEHLDLSEAHFFWQNNEKKED